MERRVKLALQQSGAHLSTPPMTVQLLYARALQEGFSHADSDSEYKEIEEAHYAYRVRDRLRKQVLVPLRKALKIPESCCRSSSIWDNIDQYRVGYVAMIKYKSQWSKTGERQMSFDKDKLHEGRVFLFPHNLCSVYYESGLCERGREMVAKQWGEMVERIVRKGKFGRCLAVSDSRAWTSSPLTWDINTALSVLVSDVTEEPWKEFIVRFRADGPRLINYGDGTPYDRFEGSRTSICSSEDRDLKKIADLILQFAIDYNLSQDQMIDRLFVFSDLEFDEAFKYDHLGRGEGWQRDYEIMRNKFEQKGYTFPEILFWSIRGSRYRPVLSMRKGVTILNGHSKRLLTYFLEEGGRIKPESMMRWSISREEYNDLIVLD